jgi:hypothetical protein
MAPIFAAEGDLRGVYDPPLRGAFAMIIAFGLSGITCPQEFLPVMQAS